MRGLIRLVLLLVVIAFVGYLMLGSWPVWTDRARTVGGTSQPDSTGTSGQIDRDAIRERGAEVGERVAEAGAVVAETMNEASLTGKIKAKMALDDHIRARTIDVTTEGTTVTLTGVVGSNAERERAVQLARETDGVANVVDRLTVR
jgi:osmotically-inducible protein OsmY